MEPKTRAVFFFSSFRSRPPQLHNTVYMILWLSRAMISIFRYLYRILLYSVLCFSNKPELVEKDLIDVPEFLVRGFIRKMDLKERITIRTKSSALRDIDDMVPLKVDGIVLKSTPPEISLCFEESIKFIFSGNNRLQAAMTQLLIVLNHPKLDLRNIRFDFFREDTDEQIMDIFSTRLTFGISVKLLHFENCSFQNLLTLLEHTTPKILNEIWITGRIHRQYNPDTIDRIFQLEQWKKAKTLVITGGLFGSMEHFSHFEELALYISGFSLQKNWADTIVIRQVRAGIGRRNFKS
ncbi:hypothetical protein CRE_04362 [Caenorhabditis remanei]|uniref:DUF38 domain-containing protein n=1 Tax=Caenorhabditis remanei TaxID=31234 RepID=E3NIB7_CAERE|nr:hypothetical protein CRE_04362 [Caenorhabditis remanei]